MFQQTTAQAKIAALRKRVRVVQGGTSSSKTFSIIPLIITYAIQNAGVDISVVSESIPHLKRGAMRDFERIMKMVGMWQDASMNKTDLTYHFKNDSRIEFFSANTPDKLRGARRDVLFVNEANNIDWEAYHQLAIRTRKFIYIDYNPTAEFWAHTELIGQATTVFIRLTYLDNEALESAIVQEIEAARDKAATSTYWANWWRVYGLGEVGSLQGVIFNNWTQTDTIPEAYHWRVYGLDWGFSNDVTAVVEVTCTAPDVVYLREVLYQNGLVNSEIAARLAAIKQADTIADSSEPKSIEDLRRAGFRIRPTVKGPDSVRSGLAKMQGLTMQVDSSSLNLIKELRAYSWQTDKSGAKLNEPEDNNNHAIDAARYAIMSKLKARSGTYSVG